uniref:Doublecortin domain-containing protein n=1 Tax=Schistosoma mansoni TaxID=6183 RepID=A0A5K4F3E8_SCHMA
MEQVRKQLGQYVPAIRCIVSPNTGTKIQNVCDIMENHRYVAVPRGEALKLLDYHKADEKSRYASNHHTSSELFEKYWRRRHIRLKSQVGRLSDGFRRNVKVIYVYRNGDTFTPAIRVHLRPIQAMDFELIMRAIEDCVILPYGKAVRRLYTLGGELVKSPEMVKDHHFYVAAGSETFLSRDYGQPLPRLITASRKPTHIYANVHFINDIPDECYTHRGQHHYYHD